MIIWVFLIKILWSKIQEKSLKNQHMVWKWTFLAYFLLGFGDLFHLGLRIIVYFAGWGPDDHLTNLFIGSGYVITGISMTYFYIAIFHAWAKLYGEKYSTPLKVKIFTAVLYSAFIVRLILMALPYNRWYEGISTVDFGFDFRIITSLPIYVIGLITVYLLIRDSIAEKKHTTGIDPEINKGNYIAALWYIISFLTYSITNFFVAFFPLTGLFMIPKTIAYLVAFYYHYKTLLKKDIRQII